MISVLVVDDELSFADLLAQRLETRGFAAFTAYNGAQALTALEEHSPDAVLLDINMPGMDGLEVLKKIQEKRPHTAVLLITGDSSLSTAIRGMKLGAADYLLKPVDMDGLQTALSTAQAKRSRALSKERMAQTAKLVALGEMATGVAHEINNPVHIILNETGWIRELFEDALPATEYQELAQALASIEAQADRCRAITAKLLTLRCSLDTRVAQTDLALLIKNILKSRAQRMKKLGITTQISLPESLQSLATPQSEWEQILTNLIDNALDAMEAKGGVLSMCVSRHEDMLHITVEDTGCGMSPKMLTRIFEPFFSTKEVGQGIGLGLSICHSIVEAMGGNICVESTIKKGSLFTVSVPLRAQQAEGL